MKRALVATLFFVGAVWRCGSCASCERPLVAGAAALAASGRASISSDALQDGTLIEALWVTMRRLLLGYVIGVVLGLPLGLLTSSSQLLEDTLGALALGLQTLPSVCWVPLALLWFGQTEGAMLFVVVMGTVWSVIIATDHGARNIPPIYARAARTMGSEGLHQWTRVILPASLPFLVSGMKQGWAFAWRSLMAAEILRHHPDRLRARPPAALWARAERDGPGDRHHGGHRADRPAGRQHPVLAVGALFAPALGHECQCHVRRA